MYCVNQKSAIFTPSNTHTMSEYYNINGMKLRVSDHEPNTALNGSSDMYIWTQDACGNKLSIGGQIDRLIEKHDLQLSDFEKVIKEFADKDEECSYMLVELK